jgi:hypothetical protein
MTASSSSDRLVNGVAGRHLPRTMSRSSSATSSAGDWKRSSGRLAISLRTTPTRATGTSRRSDSSGAGSSCWWQWNL